jgi:hypothetical protein
MSIKRTLNDEVRYRRHPPLRIRQPNLPKAILMTYRKDLKKLEDYELWREADSIAQRVLATFNQLAEEDRAHLKWKLRNRAFDITNDIAEACGTFLPKDVEYALSMTRRDVFSLKDAYRFAGRQHMLTIDPQVMVDIDNFVAKIDAEVKQTWKNIDEIKEKPEPRWRKT